MVESWEARLTNAFIDVKRFGEAEGLEQPRARRRVGPKPSPITRVPWCARLM